MAKFESGVFEYYDIQAKYLIQFIKEYLKTEECQSDTSHLIPPETQSYLDALSVICRDLKASHKSLDQICFDFENDAIAFKGIGIIIAPNLFQYLYKKVRRQLGIDMTFNSNADVIATPTSATVTANTTLNDVLTWQNTTAVTAVNNIYNTNAEWINNWATTTSGSSYNYDTVILEEKNNKKEKDNIMANFNFGAYKTDSIRFSLYGMAIKNKAGKWVSYDKKTHRLMDVEILNFDINSNEIFYKIPVAIDKVKPGDIILHNDKLVFVENVREDGKFEVIDPYEGTAITILAPMSPFGFNYLVQVVCLMDVLPEASAENPFGSFLPFILGKGDNSAFLMMLMMNDSIQDIDPMMLALMSGKNDISTFMLMQMFNQDKKNPFRQVMNKNHCSFGPAIEDKDE